METCFNYCDPDVAFFSSDERKWITRIRKLKKKFPDKITILAEPETNDGCIYCKLPTSSLRVQISVPTGRTLTEEQRKRMTEGRERKLQTS